MSTSELEQVNEPCSNIECPPHDLTRQERLKLCCKPRYRLRTLKNKGAILLLVWSYLVLTVFFINYQTNPDGNFGLEFSLQLVAGGLTLSIAGWLADVWFGRYKVVCLSIWVMWVAYMLITASTVATHLVDSSYSRISSYVTESLTIIEAVGLGAYQANIIQFGMDQLHDASTDEITSFHIWYMWAGYASGCAVNFALKCLPKEYEITKKLFVCICLSVALCLMFLSNRLLVKEPVTQNPFKLVYKVVRFAIQNNRPRYRSAFTYCEDELPSRIDFGKSKYGGPFTTEQVEDVKTFFRLMAVITVASVTFAPLFATFTLTIKLYNSLSVTDCSNQCYYKHMFVTIFFHIWAFCLPFYEVLIRPFLHSCMVVVSKSQALLVFGVLSLMMTILSIMSIEMVARHNSLHDNGNITIQCVEFGTLGNGIDYRWLAVPCALYSISVSQYAIGTFQFIAAQSPYLMRGLIMGSAYGLFFLSAAVGIAISVPFTRNLSVWGTGLISCGFWHAVLLLTVEGVTGIVLVVVLKKYKSRKREDVLPNEHIFAERYYDKDYTIS